MSYPSVQKIENKINICTRSVPNKVFVGLNSNHHYFDKIPFRSSKFSGGIDLPCNFGEGAGLITYLDVGEERCFRATYRIIIPAGHVPLFMEK